MGVSQHPDPGSGMNNPDHIFLELRNHFFAFFGVKILKFFDEDPGSGMETVRIRDPGWKKVGSGIRDKHPGSATLTLLYFGDSMLFQLFWKFNVGFTKRLKAGGLAQNDVLYSLSGGEWQEGHGSMQDCG
jgi:hypothetical protein